MSVYVNFFEISDDYLYIINASYSAASGACALWGGTAETKCATDTLEQTMIKCKTTDGTDCKYQRLAYNNCTMLNKRNSRFKRNE
ncbi:MAG: hypothetical protein MJ187_02780 [Alphaproteobacteria bacterium]|nr:hypothetical protein [Alphaproteobacteria bacterium]